MRIFFAVIIAIFLATVSYADDDVSSTKHNMQNLTTLDATAYAGATNHGEICVYCHVPHNTNTAVTAPLWNRNVNTTSTYTPYSSPTLDMAALNSGQPTGVSLACLSCHDGTIGLDVIVNQPKEGGVTPSGVTMRNTGDADYNPLLGIDLSNDHPVSVTYNPTADEFQKFRPLADVKADGLRFFGPSADEVQCASCHNPHEADATKKPFLRIANTNSNLCTTCHIK